jgi:hypothetical protein
MRDSIRLWHLCGVLVALSLAAYYPLRNNDFVDYDDETYITHNPHLIDGLSPSGVRWAWTNHEAPYWMPLTWVSLEFDTWLAPTPPADPEGAFAPSPVVVHAQNVFWHTGSTLLLFGLCRRLTGTLWRSFLVAALFAVHPMHVESVAWAIERKDVLMGFFGLLTLRAYTYYVDKPGWVPYLGVIVAFVASLLAKPMLMTLPLVLLLLDYWPLCRMRLPLSGRGTPARSGSSRVMFVQLVLEKLPLLAIAMAVAIFTMHNRPGVSFSEISLPARVMNALAGYGWYLSTTFNPSGLAVLYPHPYSDWSWTRSLAGGGMLLVITAVSLWQRHRRPWLLMGWLWFVVTLFPVIGLAQGGAQAWADRFSYWPHIGLFVAVVWGAGDLVEALQIPHPVSGGVWAVVLGCLVVLTQNQVGYWRNSTTLWEHDLAVTERNDFAHQHLSVCYRREGRIDDAEYHLHEAVRIQRDRNQRAMH